MKKINEQKLQAFTIGTMGKRPKSRKEQEEEKRKEDEKAAADAFKEFVETFQEVPTASSKIWVKAGTYDAGSRKEDNREKGKLYKPGSKTNEEKSSADKAQEYAKFLAQENKKEAIYLKKKAQDKKKSNLELFKEELRQIQEEREERHKYKSYARSQLVTNITKAPTESNHHHHHHHESKEEPTPVATTSAGGSFDNGDPNTTNLYLGNLSPKISEQQLMELFGKYGPLASIKIMWPRSEEEKSRGRNCGFVAYMSRKDAERALRILSGREVMGYDMRLGWGKSVPILSHPIYVPPALLEHTMPPTQSGLPFNAQPSQCEFQYLPEGNYKEYIGDEEKKFQMEKIMYNSVIKVVIPSEKQLLSIIHRMIEFVIREGPMFEAMVMNRELENPMFSFLFDNESSTHIYYRWKLFSLLQGDTPTEWKEKEFRMFEGGAIWKPPTANFYTQGMPDELFEDDEYTENHKGALSTAQRDRLEDLIRYLTPERSKIGDAMIFCIEHADAADEICDTIAESLSNLDTLMSKKIARLYLISDILHNCTVKVSNASFYRKAVERNLIEIFQDLNSYYMSLSRIKAEHFKPRVLKVMAAWDDWAVYPKEFLLHLRNMFLGISSSEKKPDESGQHLSGDEKEEEDLDGIPLDGAALLKSAMLRGIPGAAEAVKLAGSASSDTPTKYEDDIDVDIDGIPLEEDIDGIPLDHDDKTNQKSKGFIPSKWETVDPEQVEAQAITTSKWDTLEPVPPEPPKFYDSNDDIDDDDEGNSAEYNQLNDEKRSKLREIELKIMQYQDEIESGHRDIKTGWTMSQQVEHYRRKLLKRGAKDDYYMDSPKQMLRRSSSPSESTTSSKKSKKSKRSPSPYNKSSPIRIKNRSRSPLNYATKAKRRKSKSISPDTPKRHRDKSPYVSKSKHDRKSASPKLKKRDLSPSKHKNDKHKHKHRH